MLGDPGFPVKLAIELGIGLTMKILAELNKRGDNFNQELDFVFANVVMALIADTMLVWLPAPRATLSTKAVSVNQSALSKWLKSCPDNAFQVGSKPPYNGCLLAHCCAFVSFAFGLRQFS